MMVREDQVGRAYRVRGRVQGVGFRWWTCAQAEKLGLVGTVRNMIDGSVSVQAAGSPGALDRFEELLRRGPGSARVESLDVRALRFDGSDDGPGILAWSGFRIMR